MMHNGQKFEADIGRGRMTGELVTLRANISGLESGNMSAGMYLTHTASDGFRS